MYALPLRSVRDNVRSDVQNEIQATNRSGVPASFAGTKHPLNPLAAYSVPMTPAL